MTRKCKMSYTGRLSTYVIPLECDVMYPKASLSSVDFCAVKLYPFGVTQGF